MLDGGRRKTALDVGCGPEYMMESLKTPQSMCIAAQEQHENRDQNNRCDRQQLIHQIALEIPVLRDELRRAHFPV